MSDYQFFKKLKIPKRLRALFYARNNLDSTGQISNKTIREFLQIPPKSKSLITHFFQDFQQDNIVKLERGKISFTEEGINSINEFIAFLQQNGDIHHDFLQRFFPHQFHSCLPKRTSLMNIFS